MVKRKKQLTAVDLFAGAGGLSLGFEEEGFKVLFAVENDKHSAETYKNNRGKYDTEVIVSDISKVDFRGVLKRHKLKMGEIDILLAGPPCQGFSTANMKTRNPANPLNLLFKEFLRAVSIIHPKWLLFENVAGFLKYEDGKLVKVLNNKLLKLGYDCTWDILNCADYGVPQIRKRFFFIGKRMGAKISFHLIKRPAIQLKPITVSDAISDLPRLVNGNWVDKLPYRFNGNELSSFQYEMRKNWKNIDCLNNLVTKNNSLVLRRYEFIPRGGNWQDIPKYLMNNYKNTKNCHSGIYKRLALDQPSNVISNFRKCMLIHPEQDRGLSVREAARLQSFPDDYIFLGPLGNQQQQVANAVPPLLAKSIAKAIRVCYKNETD